MDKFDGRSMDIEAAQKEKLQAIFPECFAEGKLDIDKLLSLCGEYIDKDGEKYQFEWNGKRESLKLAQTRSMGTLRPAPAESVDWDTTQNLYIEGDNLEVLKLLQTAYYRRVKMIYIDPPYNTGNDFVYNDDFADPMSRYKEITSQMTKSNPEVAGRYHTNWLNMMYPRLRLAANLLRDDGVIFISIDDNEVHNLHKLCDEVFGEENFVSQMIWQKKTGASDAVTIATITEYILVYAKQIDQTEFSKNTESYDLNRYKFTDQYEAERGPYYIDNLDRGGLQYSDSLNYGIECPDGTITFPNGRTEYVNDGWIWKWSKAKIEWARENGFIEFRKSTSKPSGWSVCYKNYLKVDNENKPIERSAPHKNLITNILNANAAAVMKELFDTNNYFNYSKPVELLKYLVSLIKFNPDDIILDFFSGSGTTAHAVMQLNAEDGGNRKFIMVQLPEQTDEKSEAFKAGYKNICEIGKERIRRAGTKIKEQANRKILGLDLGTNAIGWALIDGNNKIVDCGAKITPLVPPKESTLFDEAADTSYRATETVSKIMEKNIADNRLDTGFKVFKLDDSNLVAWNTTPIKESDLPELWDRFTALTETIKGNRSELDVVYEVMAKMGVPLTHLVREMTVGTKKTYSVGDNMLLVCLEKGITPEDVEAMCELAPYWLIAAEEAFADDTALSNAHYTVKARNIKMELL